MIIGVRQITLHLPFSHSLKDERQIIKIGDEKIAVPLPQVNAMSEQNSPDSVYILGVRVNRVGQQQALDAIEQMIARRRASEGRLGRQHRY